MRGAKAISVIAASLLGAIPGLSQAQRPGGSEAHMTSAEAAAPFDPTGYWVSVITHDWLERMVVPQRGLYPDVPMTQKAKEFADAWQAGPVEAAGNQCEAYGAAAIMQVPEQLHITWQDPNTLQVQTDAGMQTRLLHFQPDPAMANAAPSRQGYSVAQWVIYRPALPQNLPRIAPPPETHYGWLQVGTTDMLPGLLRKNGVPYSGHADMSENWVLNTEADGDEWLTVTTTLNDPEYLSIPYVVNAIFNREANGSRWDPAPCSLTY